MIKSLDILSFISCNSTITLSKQRQEHDHLARDNKIEETSIPGGTDVNEHLETPDPPLGLASGYCCLLLRLLVLAADGYWMMLLLDVGYYSLLVVG